MIPLWLQAGCCKLGAKRKPESRFLDLAEGDSNNG